MHSVRRLTTSLVTRRAVTAPGIQETHCEDFITLLFIKHTLDTAKQEHISVLQYQKGPSISFHRIVLKSLDSPFGFSNFSKYSPKIQNIKLPDVVS